MQWILDIIHLIDIYAILRQVLTQFIASLPTVALILVINGDNSASKIEMKHYRFLHTLIHLLFTF